MTDLGLERIAGREPARRRGVESEAVDEARNCGHGGGVFAYGEHGPVGCSGGPPVFDLVVAEVVEGLHESCRRREGITDEDAERLAGMLELGQQTIDRCQ
jgi:hypothetical protein